MIFQCNINRAASAKGGNPQNYLACIQQYCILYWSLTPHKHGNGFYKKHAHDKQWFFSQGFTIWSRMGSSSVMSHIRTWPFLYVVPSIVIGIQTGGEGGRKKMKGLQRVSREKSEYTHKRRLSTTLMGTHPQVPDCEHTHKYWTDSNTLAHTRLMATLSQD
jgi:hypothetical protein